MRIEESNIIPWSRVLAAARRRRRPLGLATPGRVDYTLIELLRQEAARPRTGLAPGMPRVGAGFVLPYRM